MRYHVEYIQRIVLCVASVDDSDQGRGTRMNGVSGNEFVTDATLLRIRSDAMASLVRSHIVNGTR